MGEVRQVDRGAASLVQGGAAVSDRITGPAYRYLAVEVPAANLETSSVAAGGSVGMQSVGSTPLPVTEEFLKQAFFGLEGLGERFSQNEAYQRELATANHAIKFWRHDPPSALHRDRMLAYAIEVTEKRRLHLEAQEHIGLLKDSL